MDEPPSSPPTESTSPKSAVAYYKAQYEQLEHELAEFQASSQELEAELEKDVVAAEKRERALKQKAESLGFEVEEWKTKYKQSKAEANAAQNALQKEVTTLRDSNRTLQLKLRDIEVANDDFERQARNTSSSLEDLESKFNMAIERAVMMEEEIKIGEQERESLRIETQRLRDELSDLKIEAEITQDKLKKQSTRHVSSTGTIEITAPNSPSYEDSPNSAASSPMVTTPLDTKSVSTIDTVSETLTPPSPPISDKSTKHPIVISTPMRPPPSKIRMPSAAPSITPKPSRVLSTTQSTLSSRATIPSNPSKATPTVARNTTNKAPIARGLPHSTSLTHIRSLTAQMQRLEQRVQSARSRLPAPTSTPPRASPRSSEGSTLGHPPMPPSVTIRSRKRTGGSTVSGGSSAAEDTPQSTRRVSRISTSGISRLSFGPLSIRDGSESSIPSSRPSSRASGVGFAKPERPQSRTDVAKPLSRASMSGSRTPLGHYSQSALAESRRPRSSIGGNFAASIGHGHSQSISQIDLDGFREPEYSTPTRRATLSRQEIDRNSIATPNGISRRQSSGFSLTPSVNRRTSMGILKEAERKKPGTDMKPPIRTKKLSGVGESY